jgi:hypothetical protein
MEAECNQLRYKKYTNFFWEAGDICVEKIPRFGYWTGEGSAEAGYPGGSQDGDPPNTAVTHGHNKQGKTLRDNE